MIRLEGVTFAYSGQPPVFEGFHWHVAPGEAWAVIGPSGCGKSTLLYLIAGLRQPMEGHIIVASQPVTRPRANIGLVLQDYGLLPWATVWDNAALGMRIGRFYGNGPWRGGGPRPYPPPDLPAEQVDFWLRRLGIEALRDKYPGQISGGQRQRTAIARTLVLKPDVLLLDEPFSSLDALTREDLQRLIVELRAEVGVTTVLVTHSIEEAVFLGERILVLGRPPIRTALTVENPDAGQVAYRDTVTFHEKCAVLRAYLASSGA
jgi:ABC-type nitrate/sulfonate/bicarbonate transport system ATPase subunit